MLRNSWRLGIWGKDIHYGEAAWVYPSRKRRRCNRKVYFLTTSHDGTGSITAFFTPIRIVCQNTLNAAVDNRSNFVRLRHTAGVKQRLENAHQVMGLADLLSTRLEGIFNQWSRLPIDDQQVKHLIQ